MNINRDYLIINDVKKSNIKLDNGSMCFYITDKNTQNIFVNLVINISNNDLIQKYANIENAEDYTLTMNIVKPDNTYKIVEGKLHDKEKAIFEFNLKSDCCDKIGTYRCELLTKCNINEQEEITTSNKITYKVKSSVLNDLDDIVEAPEYPLVIQLFDKLSDIEQYEEDRRANELARQLAEEQRQTRFDVLDADMTDRIKIIDNKLVEIDNVLISKEDIADIKAKNTEQDRRLDVAENRLDNINTNIENVLQPTVQRVDAIEAINTTQNDRLNAVEVKNQQQDNRLDVAENGLANIGNDITNTMQPIIDEHTSRLDAIEAIDVAQNNRLEAIEVKNQQQDDRLLDIEKVNNKQDIDIKCLYGASQTIDVTKEGNSIYLQNSNNGFAVINEIKGNTLVNCNKEADKELILNGNINTQGYSNVTLTKGVDGGLVDVALEGNTMVNVCDQKDPVAITKSYTVETGNHVALQGEYDGKCRPVVTGNTLWIDNDTEDVLTAFDESKNLRLQSSFEDKLVTQEMVDSGEEVADNLGKYKVEYKVTGKNLLKVTSNQFIKGFDATGLTRADDYSTDFIPFNIPSAYYGERDRLVGYFENTELTWCKVAYYNAEKQRIGGSHQDDIRYFKHLSINSGYSYKDVKYVKISSYNPQALDNMTAYIGKELDCYEDAKYYTKTLYLNSPLLEGDTIEEKDNGIYHVHRYAKVVLDGTQRANLDAVNIDGLIRVVYSINNLYKVHANNDTRNTIYCDKIKTCLYSSNMEHITNIIYTNPYANGIELELDSSVYSDLDTVQSWLQQNSVTVVYKLASPQYEVISQNDTILCDSYTNGHLDVDSVVPIEKVDFLPFTDELTYLYSSTQYAVQFVSNAVSKVDITLGGAKLLNQNVVVGTNKYTITTPSELIDNNLVLNGEGFNASNIVVTEATDQDFGYFEGMKSVGECEDLEVVSSNSDGTLSNTQTLTHEPLRAVGDIKDRYVLIDGKWYIERNCGVRAYQEGDKDNYITDMINTVYPLSTPTYEQIDYNPFTVYSDITHISNNSTIPCNMTIKNTGYNCLLKPSTTYTVSSNLGLNTVTTPSVLSEDCLRFYDTDTSTVTTMKNVTILEGDYTTGKPLPAHFSGIESAFEQEYDEVVGKYKVKIRVQNEDASKENYIEFYINEPLRGIRDAKDKVYVKDDKVVVERNCGQREYQDGDFGAYLTDKVNTVYQLAEPVYEEVEYNDVKLFIESFKNSTLFYNSNVPVTSKLYYSYSVPIVDKVAQTANVTDQQDSMIIDLATQCAIMEMYLM